VLRHRSSLLDPASTADGLTSREGIGSNKRDALSVAPMAADAPDYDKALAAVK
jgi:hypothetical protein